MPETTRDYDAVARQLGRGPRPFRVAARCPFGLPSVIENERRREMPTSFWVTCPSLVAAISRLESTGGVGEAREAVGASVVEGIHAVHRSIYGTRVAGVRDEAPRQRQVPPRFHGPPHLGRHPEPRRRMDRPAPRPSLPGRPLLQCGGCG